ncbi:MAG TPA: dihydrodipicolinate reductase C-terminal domain-containing protein [Thermoanaerobaculia bacterium]|jgi:4-hydroxy-tetrahydrodipicolinate reductase|nr:dihydrodipicolinate reductase C-terminal domain-containing protein [Thermoanaerobaculia bacterium]
MSETVHRLALLGYGKMGRMLEDLAPAHGFAVALKLDGKSNPGGSGLTAEALRDIEVAIDFSVPGAVAANVERLAGLGVPVVVGTTGWQSDLPRLRAHVESLSERGAGLLYGANFSVGVQVFYRLAETAARLLAGVESYDAWLYEIHHRMKKDAPSGTLKEIQRVLTAAGYDRPIDVASNRAGAIPGTHQIGFDSEADTILLEHRARNRTGFAQGALRAARWMLGRRGVYEFSTVWEEVIQS